MTATRIKPLMIRKIQALQTKTMRKRVVDAAATQQQTDNVGGNKGLLGLLSEFVMVGGDFV